MFTVSRFWRKKPFRVSASHEPGSGVPLRGLGTAASATLGVVKVALGVTGACYLGALALVYTFQRKLLYFPDPNQVSVSALPARFSEVEEFSVLSGQNKVVCKGWYWPPPKYAEVPDRNTFVLMLHGNAGSRVDRLAWMEAMREGLRVGIACIDYRGYGGSEGKPSETGMVEDGRAALKWLKDRVGKGRVVLHCESIGSGVGLALAADAAQEEQRQGGGGGGGDGVISPHAVVVEGGFSSISDVAANAVPFLLPRVLLKDKWNNVEKARILVKNNSKLPFLFLHGDGDTIVPIEFGRKLARELPERNRTFISWPRADHNQLPYCEGYFTVIDDFLSERGL